MSRGLPTVMAAVLLEGHGGFDRLRYRTDVPVPRPGPDEVLIRVADVCGRIVAVGSDVDQSRLGRRVIVQSCLRSRRGPAGIPWLGSECDGGFAQYVVAPAQDSWDVAGALSDIELA